MPGIFELLQFQPYFLNDYYIYLVSSYVFRVGGPIYGITDSFIHVKDITNLSFHWGTGFSYPPPLLILLTPFTFLPPIISGYMWFGLLCFLYAVYIRRIFRKRHSNSLLLFFLTFLPALGSLYVGQINIVLLWLLTFFLERKNEYVRGLLLGFMSVIKPHLLLLIIPELMTKKFRSVGTTVMTGFGLLSLTPGYSYTYVTDILLSLQTNADVYFHLQSFHALVLRLFSTAPGNVLKDIVDISVPLLLFLFLIWRKNGTQIYYVWLAYLSLFAGLNSFINLTILLPAYLYVIEYKYRTDRFNAFLKISIFAITNGLFIISILVERLFTPHTAFGTLVYAFFSSLGCISTILLFVLLLRINRADHNSRNRNSRNRSVAPSI